MAATTITRDMIEEIIRRHIWVKPDQPERILGAGAASAEIAALMFVSLVEQGHRAALATGGAHG